MILVIESSTASSKAMLFDPVSRSVMRTADRVYPQIIAHVGETGLHDCDAVFGLTVALGQELAEGQHIEAVALGGTFHSIVVCGADMRPITPTYTWMYNGARKTAAQLRQSAEYTNHFYRRTGCMVNAMYAAFQMIHLKKQGFSFQDTFLLSQSAYNFYQLTGERRESPATVSGMGLINAHTRDWDAEILSEIGVTPVQLGQLTHFRQTTPLSDAGAALLGLKPGIPVLVSHPDGALNQVGSGALVEGIMTFSMGTSAALRLSCRSPLIPKTPSTWCYLSPDAWMSGAATNGACNCVDWAKPLLFGKRSYGEIEKIPPDYHTIPYFLPFLFGERCPGWDDEREGGFVGLGPEHTPLDLYFSVLEGILFNLYQCYTLLRDVAGVPKEIKLSGGVLNSKIWKQMAADIFGEELHCEKISNASMVGAAVLGMAVTGYIERLEDWKAHTQEIITPDPEQHELFMKRYEKYTGYYYERKK